MAQETSTGWNLSGETDGVSSLIGHNPSIIHFPRKYPRSENKKSGPGSKSWAIFGDRAEVDGESIRCGNFGRKA